MNNINFIAIDFETATAKRSSICEAGICVVKGGKVVETKSWLVRPEDNRYSYWNIQVHGIRPQDTAYAPTFPKVWEEITTYLRHCPVLVAHNAAFDMSCIRHTLQLHHLPCPDIDYYCSLCAARHIYNFGCNSLDYLCDHFSISYGTHHRAGDDAKMCARLFLQEIKDGNFADVSDLNFCTGKL